MDYNLIIPVVYKDYSFLRKTLRFVQKNLSATKIFILTDGRMAKYLSKEIRNSPIYQIVDENSLLGGLTYQKIYQIIKSQGREHTNTGWFFQQFLKLGFALSEYCDTEYYLSWDADTIPVIRSVELHVRELDWIQPYIDMMLKQRASDREKKAKEDSKI